MELYGCQLYSVFILEAHTYYRATCQGDNLLSNMSQVICFSPFL